MEAIVITKENFEEQVLRAEKPVLVDFWAPWCTYCRRIAPAVDQVAGQYGEQMVVGKVNVDEQPELAIRFGVMSIPTVIFLKDGKEIDRKVGVMPAGAFTQVLDQNL